MDFPQCVTNWCCWIHCSYFTLVQQKQWLHKTIIVYPAVSRMNAAAATSYNKATTPHGDDAFFFFVLRSGFKIYVFQIHITSLSEFTLILWEISAAGRIYMQYTTRALHCTAIGIRWMQFSLFRCCCCCWRCRFRFCISRGDSFSRRPICVATPLYLHRV